MRGIVMTMALLALAAPAAAQHQHGNQGAQQGEHQHPAGIPEGWQARLDRADASMDDVRVMRMGDHLHAVTGPALILWQPETTATGAYRAEATFTQNRPSQHPEAYGLIAGGRDLQGEGQDYLYFLVRQDGKFLVKHRAGGETHTLFDWTEHDAVRQPGADGRATNELAIEARPNAAVFLVNGTVVARLVSEHLNTAGIVGLRINHNLDVMVRDFEVTPAS